MRLTWDGTHHYNVFASPDGEWIYFDADRGGRPAYVPAGGWDLHRIPAAGGPWEDVTADPAHATYDGDVSPDGGELLFKRVGSPGLWWMRLGAPASAKLLIEESAFSPRWSPDGRRIAFVSERDGHREIYLCDSDGSDPRRLTRSR